jgi:hypothetical protein
MTIGAESFVGSVQPKKIQPPLIAGSMVSASSTEGADSHSLAESKILAK